MYCENGSFRCDRCGKMIEDDVTVLDTTDYAQNLSDLEGVELCADCYDEFMAEQKKVIDSFVNSLQFDWHKDNEDTFADWLHDDITWCRRECPRKECERNNKNIRSHGLHSYSDFYKEGKCPKEAKCLL